MAFHQCRIAFMGNGTRLISHTAVGIGNASAVGKKEVRRSKKVYLVPECNVHVHVHESWRILSRSRPFVLGGREMASVYSVVSERSNTRLPARAQHRKLTRQ
ncbi:hypothetical protein SCLCIDRAFT_782906 [Scleroderma citrinum Foug A]|uniref:Uncharacterized protein n=1 Tax=Scleroderma citrinum Foug A TaxID=1036808 RepID=A0A0C3E356_9AGAM|nr:hypothetical protein SCLCIDRAFT_782906 [Scleroderma citrinum Foug A]